MKRILMLALCLTVVFSSVSIAFGEKNTNDADKPAFSDIKGHWAEKTINKIAGMGIVNGVGNNTFQPDAYMTRCQFAAMMHKALGLQIRYFRACNINEIYHDVKNEAWYACQLYDLVSTGIVDDIVAYRPESNITREEMAHYIMRAYEYKTGPVTNYQTGNINKFKDSDKLSPEFSNDVCKAVELRFIMGKGNDLFEPKGNSTRAEVAVVMDRFLNCLNAVNE